MRILIAEDDLASRIILAAVLKKNGYEVEAASNGLTAWEAMQKPDAPRLAILDWIMPEMDGLEVVRRIRTRSTERPPYLIMLTMKSEKADIIAGLDAGADDYLAKPFDPGELRARVEAGRRIVEMQTALLESRGALAYQATHDSLTGLLNRRAILDELYKELTRATRYGDKLVVGMCDVDHFKAINDTYGHQTGDDVLGDLARILSGSLREYDAVGRMGGEEFLVIAPLKAGTDSLSTFERLRQQIAGSRISTRSGELSITISIGVADATAMSTVDQLLSAADAALYRAKAQGRNRVALANAGI